uniref:Movement protein TGBp3 n=1 Tax=Passiflora latent virus TaxID=379892 RepID=A0A346CJL8_9VIRU|nr:TgBP3 [Passiflora latent virus]
MWSSSLMISVGLVSFCLTWLIMGSWQRESCLMVLTGESIRIQGCNLSPEHIKALSQLKALQVSL